MSLTLTRSRTEQATRNEQTTITEWSVLGPEGAVSFWVQHPAAGTHGTPVPEVFGAIGVHHTVRDGDGDGVDTVHLPAGECHLLAAGTCRGDSTWRHGRDLGEQWDATGRADETIYAERQPHHVLRLLT
jgi:hypothetical protein